MTKTQLVTFCSIFFILTSSSVLGQSDSLNFKRIQKKLQGCWKSKYYKFKYDSKRNLGNEFNSPVHSSAPIFRLILKDDEVYLEWIEFMGGEHFQKIIWFKKNKLKVENKNDSKTRYRKIKNCK